METIVLNIIGGPGAGKTTIASEVFVRLKKLNVDCENVFEFAKELVWSQRNNAFNDRLYMHAMQNHRLFLINGKVEVIVCDSPLLLTSIYNHFYLENEHSSSYNKMIDTMVLETWKLYHNVTYFIERDTCYVDNGRRESNAEALEIDKRILNYLEKNKIPYQKVSLEKAADQIYDDIKERLGK